MSGLTQSEMNYAKSIIERIPCGKTKERVKVYEIPSDIIRSYLRPYDIRFKEYTTWNSGFKGFWYKATRSEDIRAF